MRTKEEILANLEKKGKISVNHKEYEEAKEVFEERLKKYKKKVDE